MLYSALFALLCLSLSCENVLSKENRSKNSSTRRKQIHNKCVPLRCNIVCPIEVLYPPPVFNGAQPPEIKPPIASPVPPSQVPPVSVPDTPSTEASTVGAPTSPPPVRNSPLPNLENQTVNLVSQLANGVNQVPPELSNILGNNSGLSDRHHLSHRKKHFNFKKLVLANRNGKKAYKFRQLSSSCYVTCQSSELIGQSVIHQDPGITYSQQQPLEGADNEVDESDDDQPYVAGEDDPIEVTRFPGSPSRRVGDTVDFIGFDDFGPDGFPAKEFAEAEDKKKIGKKH